MRHRRHVSLLFLLLLLGRLEPLGAQDDDRPLFKSAYRVINVHRHCDAPSEAAVRAELEVMDRVGIDVMVILLMENGWSSAHLPQWLELKRKYPDRLAIFGYIDWSRSDQEGFFEEIVREVKKVVARR